MSKVDLSAHVVIPSTVGAESASDGGPAFPCSGDLSAYGMSLREWYVGQAVAGLCANPRMATSNIARLAHRIADEVMEEYQ